MTTTFHRHWRDVPESGWRWPNFSPAEIACLFTLNRSNAEHRAPGDRPSNGVVVSNNCRTSTDN